MVPAFVMAVWELGRRAALGLDVSGVRAVALMILFLSGATDVLDGYLARSMNATSHFGAIVDAVADKFTQVSALVALTLLGPPGFPQLPYWLLGCVLLRDLVLGGGSLAMKRAGRPVNVEHEFHGRVATLLVYLVLLGATADVSGTVLLVASALAGGAALVSAGGYVRRAAAA